MDVKKAGLIRKPADPEVFCGKITEHFGFLRGEQEAAEAARAI